MLLKFRFYANTLFRRPSWPTAFPSTREGKREKGGVTCKIKKVRGPFTPEKLAIECERVVKSHLRKLKNA